MMGGRGKGGACGTVNPGKESETALEAVHKFKLKEGKEI